MPGCSSVVGIVGSRRGRRFGDYLFSAGRSCAGLSRKNDLVTRAGKDLLQAAAISFLSDNFGAVCVACLAVSAKGDGGTSRAGASPSGGVLGSVLLITPLRVSSVLVVGKFLGVVGSVAANLAGKDATAPCCFATTGLLGGCGWRLSNSVLFTGVVDGGGGNDFVTAGCANISRSIDGGGGVLSGGGGTVIFSGGGGGGI